MTNDASRMSSFDVRRFVAFWHCGCSSMVELLPSKQDDEGSIPFTRFEERSVGERLAAKLGTAERA